MQTLGYDNVFIGTVEGKPEETACENVIEAVKAAGYRASSIPLMSFTRLSLKEVPKETTSSSLSPMSS